MVMGMRLPFQRRETRWDRLRNLATSRDLARWLSELERLREVLPEPDKIRRRVQPLVDRAAAARADLNLPEPPAFLQDRFNLDRLAALGRKTQRSRSERVLTGQAPLWVALTLGIGGFMLGFVVGSALAARGTAVPVDLESAADKIKDEWPSSHDDDIREAQGNLKKLSSVIGERTGEDTRAVRERLATMTSVGHSPNGEQHG